MKSSHRLALAAATTLLLSTTPTLAQKSYDFSAPPSDADPAPTTVIVSVIEETPADVTVTIDAPPGGFPTYTPPPPPPPSATPPASSAAAPAAQAPPANSPSSAAPAPSHGASAPAPPAQSGALIPTNSTGAPCGPSCAMSVSFTGLNVPFAVGQGQANIMSGMTRDVCLCFDAGPTRAVIGTTDTGAMATLFEGSASGAGQDGYLDVSFVQGYTYPMVCTGQGGSSGCSTDLYAVSGAKCPDGHGGGTKMGDVCNNPQGPAGARNPGPPPPGGNSPTQQPWCQACSAPDAFFAPCAGGAYTYPYDDIAMASGTEIVCCVGPQCEQKKDFKKGGDMGNCASGDVSVRKDPCTPCAGTGSCTSASKRGLALEEVLENAVVAEKEKRTGGSVHLRRHRHHHGAAGGFGHKH